MLTLALSGRFNLVIERLLISGVCAEHDSREDVVVSISLSSGFSFQEVVGELFHRQADEGFNLVIERLLISGPSLVRWGMLSCLFQSRYRAASHFRQPAN